MVVVVGHRGWVGAGCGQGSGLRQGRWGGTRSKVRRKGGYSLFGGRVGIVFIPFLCESWSLYGLRAVDMLNF